MDKCVSIGVYTPHIEQTGKAKGVYKANVTNGNAASVCILYKTRVLLQNALQSII